MHIAWDCAALEAFILGKVPVPFCRRKADFSIISLKNMAQVIQWLVDHPWIEDEDATKSLGLNFWRSFKSSSLRPFSGYWTTLKMGQCMHQRFLWACSLHLQGSGRTTKWKQKRSPGSVACVYTIFQKSVTLIAFHLRHFVRLCCDCLVLCVLVCLWNGCCPSIFRNVLNLLLDPHGRFYTSYFASLFYLVFVAQLVEAQRYKPECGGFESMVLLKFFIDIILPTALWSWRRLSL